MTICLLSSLLHAEDSAAPVTAPPPALAPDTPPPPPATAAEAPASTSLAPADNFLSTSPAPESPEPTATPSQIEASKDGKKDGNKDEPSPTVSETPVETADSLVPVPQTTPTPPAEEIRAESVVEARRERGVPYFQTTRPTWGVEITGAIKALGGQDVESSQGGAPTRAVEIQTEYQFPFLQRIGVISAGPSLSIFPITPTDTVTSNPASIWAVGGQVRYQARFFREQPIVPMAGFEAQYMTYHFADGNTGATSLTGPFFGAMFLLNIIEPSAASEMYIDTGISRSYLVAELKSLTGTDGTVAVSGQSIFFGLRFEF